MRTRTTRAAIVALALTAALPGVAVAAPAITERVDPIPPTVGGKVTWGPDGRAWTLSSVKARIAVGTPKANGSVSWAVLPAIRGVLSWHAAVVGADGGMYATAFVDQGAATGVGRLVKLDATTGRVIWQRAIQRPVGIVGRTGGGASVLTRGDTSTAGTLRSYDAAGRVRGRALRVPNEVDSVRGASPVSVRKRVLTVVNRDDAGQARLSSTGGSARSERSPSALRASRGP